VIATLVSPVNWFACASWLSGLKPAKDLTEAQETIQIERVDGGKMLTLIHTAWSALNDVTEFAAFAKTIDAKFKIGAR
jgi:nitrogen fixation protein